MKEQTRIITPAGPQDAAFIAHVYQENLSALHGAPISLEEWQAFLAADDPDEAHFILREGDEPCAWLKLNGLEGDDAGWISMLVVLPERQHSGFGRLALDFAEDFLRNRGKRRVRLHTTGDNQPALSLYRRMGYEIADQQDCRWDDGTLLPDVTLTKTL